MSKLVVHKSLTPKAIFRMTGINIYNRPGWDIVQDKQELITYLSQFKLLTLSIGPLEGMTTLDVAKYIKSIYDATQNTNYPSIFVLDEDKGVADEIKKMFAKEKKT